MRRAVAIVLAISAWTAGASADPSVWQAAARRELRPPAQALAKADRLFAEYLILRREGGAAFRPQLLLERARKMLENTGAVRSTDPRARFLLAQVYYRLYDAEHSEQLLQQAARHYAFVAGSNAPLIMRADALNDLAICYARLGRHREEVEAYGRALAIEPHSEARAVLLANRAEGFMVQGDITNAVRGYRASLREMPGALLPDMGPTTMWGLAVSLDRSGDLDGALAQIGLARGYDPGDEKLQSDSWFFVPEYDESWYSALGYWRSARVAENGEAQQEMYKNAIAAWRAYIDRAPQADHWLALAGLRLRQCENERDAAIQRPKRARRTDPNAEER